MIHAPKENFWNRERHVDHVTRSFVGIFHFPFNSIRLTRRFVWINNEQGERLRDTWSWRHTRTIPPKFHKNVRCHFFHFSRETQKKLRSEREHFLYQHHNEFPFPHNPSSSDCARHRCMYLWRYSPPTSIQIRIKFLYCTNKSSFVDLCNHTLISPFSERFRPGHSQGPPWRSFIAVMKLSSVQYGAMDLFVRRSWMYRKLEAERAKNWFWGLHGNCRGKVRQRLRHKNEKAWSAFDQSLLYRIADKFCDYIVSTPRPKTQTATISRLAVNKFP